MEYNHFSLKESFYTLTHTIHKNHDDSVKKIKDRWMKNSTCKSLLNNYFTVYIKHSYFRFTG